MPRLRRTRFAPIALALTLLPATPSRGGDKDDDADLVAKLLETEIRWDADLPPAGDQGRSESCAPTHVTLADLETATG